jgi:hypothetical protein
VRFTADPAPAAGQTVVLGGGSGATNPYPIVVKTGDADPVKFELQQLVTLTNAAPEAWGLVEQSESHTERFDSSGFLGQEIRLSRTPYLSGSILVVAGNGGFSEVESFLNSTGTDKHYTVRVDNNEVAIVRFGDQVNGTLPSGQIDITYKTGGGSKGNVEPDSINQIDGSFRTNTGLAVNVKVLNYNERATGGADRETEAQIRENGPRSLRVLTRAVAREDFEILATTKYGMARALMLTSNEDADVPLNTGHFYMIPSAERGQQVGFPTAAKMDEVLRRIRSDYPYPSTFEVRLKAPIYLDIAIQARIYLRKGYSHAQVRAQVEASLDDYFALYNVDGSSNSRVDFGFYYQAGAADGAKVLPLSDLMNTVRDCPGVHRLGVYEADFVLSAYTVTSTNVVTMRLGPNAHRDVVINKHEFPRLDKVWLLLVDGATGENF